MIISAFFLTTLSIPLGPLPPIGDLLEPLGGIWTLAEDIAPIGHQTLDFPGLKSPVEVYRDSFYVPHIFAEDDLDLFMAIGYIQASDRLFQMDIQRRAGKGSLSEVLGSSMVETDKFLRSIGLKWAAELTLERMDNETLGALRAFADGVNTYIGEASPHRLPLEFKLLNYRPSLWEPLDSIAFGKFMAWSLSGGFTDLELGLFEDEFGAEALAELFPVDMPLQLPIIPTSSPQPSPSRYDSPVPSADLSRDVMQDLLSQYHSLEPLYGQFQAIGSNNWVVDGTRSATGAPILANDPHLDLTLPSIWYQLRLSSPSYNVYGVALLGAPVVLIGFNENIAWGFTNVGADVVDFFEEKVRPENEMQYLYRGQWKDFEVREEVIHVKGGSPVTLEMKISVHGPIITSHDQTVSMQWTGHRPTFELRALLNLSRASGWGSFRRALQDFHVPAQNIVYADNAGNIGIVVNGLFPIRGQGLGRVPVDGSTGDYDWVGFVPFDELPVSFNPSQGFLVSANQKPTLENDPYLGWDWADRFRAVRINEVLEASNSISVDDIKALQLDHISVAAREFVPFLISAFQSLDDDGASIHPKAPEAIGRIVNWTIFSRSNMDARRVEPTLYWMWLYNYREAAFRDEWDAHGLNQVRLPSVTVLEALTRSEPSSLWFDDVRTELKVEDRDDVIRKAFVETLNDLEREMGTEMDEWLWGDLHVLQIRHLTELEALSSEVMARDGGSFTLDVAHGSFTDGNLLVTSGPSWRMIVDFAPTLAGGLPEGIGSYPGGQSGNPLSPHYQDLLELWRNGEYQELQLSDQEDFAAVAVTRGWW